MQRRLGLFSWVSLIVTFIVPIAVIFYLYTSIVRSLGVLRVTLLKPFQKGSLKTQKGRQQNYPYPRQPPRLLCNICVPEQSHLGPQRPRLLQAVISRNITLFESRVWFTLYHPLHQSDHLLNGGQNLPRNFGLYLLQVDMPEESWHYVEGQVQKVLQWINHSDNYKPRNKSQHVQ